MSALHGRPARFVFSARIAREHLDLLSGYGALLTDLRESEDLGPLKSAAPKGRLIVLLQSTVLNPPRE